MSKPLRADFVLSATTPADFPSKGLPEVALVGRSNVGKSSVLNQLVAIKRLAFVSRTPGRTQLINFFQVDGRFYLVDLPGYGFARVPVAVRRNWESLISSYLFDRSELRLALLIVDARREPMPNDLAVCNLLVRSGVPYAVVATKSDKLSRARMAQQGAKLRETFAAQERVPFITFSAVIGEGRKELWNAIEKHLRGPRPPRRTK